MKKLSEMVSEKDSTLIQGEVEIQLENVKLAKRMLWKLWDRYFAEVEKKPLYAYEQEDISDTLYAIDDIIFKYIQDTELFFGIGEDETK